MAKISEHLQLFRLGGASRIGKEEYYWVNILISNQAVLREALATMGMLKTKFLTFVIVTQSYVAK